MDRLEREEWPEAEPVTRLKVSCRVMLFLLVVPWTVAMGVGCGEEPTAGDATFYVVGTNALANCTLEFDDNNFAAAVPVTR